MLYLTCDEGSPLREFECGWMSLRGGRGEGLNGGNEWLVCVV